MTKSERHGPWRGPVCAFPFPVYTVAGTWEWCCLVEFREVHEREAGYPWMRFEWRRMK